MRIENTKRTSGGQGMKGERKEKSEGMGEKEKLARGDEGL